MKDRDSQFLEAILAKYRPAEAPEELLCRVEQAALWRRRAWHERCSAAMSVAAEVVLGFIVRGLVTATTAIVLLLIAAGGY